MDRYIASELAMPFLFGIGAFSMIGLVVGSLFDLVQKVTESELPLLTALHVFSLQVPNFVVLSFPMSTLLTTLIGYSRLSGDSEIVALRASGVSIYRLVLPAIALSVLVTGITFLFNESVVPVSNYRASSLMDQALKQNKPAFQEKNIFYREFANQELSRLFYARRFDGQRMQNVMLLDFSAKRLGQIVAAKSAVWSAAENHWNFFNGTIYVVAIDGSYRNVLSFERHPLQLSRVPLELATQNRKPEQMNISEAQDYLNLLEQTGDQRQIRQQRLQVQEKYALPSICVIFGLVGTALGIRPQRTSTITGFGISIVIIFSYYLLAFVSSSLGTAGVVSPVMAAWLPTLAGATVGGLLLQRVAR